MKVNGLYFIWSYSEETPYLEAVSYSVEKLQEIQESIKDKECFQDGRFEIREVPVYIAYMKNNKIKLSMINSSQIHSFYDGVMPKIYCMNVPPELLTSTTCNKTPENGTIDQALLLLLFTHRNDAEYLAILEQVRNSEIFLDNDFSENPIEFDKYYDEGVINA